MELRETFLVTTRHICQRRWNAAIISVKVSLLSEIMKIYIMGYGMEWDKFEYVKLNHFKFCIPLFLCPETENSFKNFR